MRYSFHRILLILGFIGLTKAGGLIKLIILGAIGLAGLYLLQNISHDLGLNNGKPHKLLAKRSLENYQIDWSYVVKNDPSGCARSFICQLAAQRAQSLDPEGLDILSLIQAASEQDSYAAKALIQALKHGEHLEHPSQCRKIYKLCPYSSKTMMALLDYFDQRTDI